MSVVHERGLEDFFEQEGFLSIPRYLGGKKEQGERDASSQADEVCGENNEFLSIPSLVCEPKEE